MYDFITIELPNTVHSNEIINQDSCINCFSYGTKIFDINSEEVICKSCGCVDQNKEHDTNVSEMMKVLYKNNVMLKTDDDNPAGNGSTIITSYEAAMDYSKSGLISSKISDSDVNKKKIKNTFYTKLIFTERNTLRSISTNREVNIMEGISTIGKITEKLRLPKHIAERAANIFRMFYPKDKQKKIKYINITNLINNKRGTDKNVSAKFVSITCIYYALKESQDITSLIEFVNIILKNDCVDSKLYTKDVLKKIINKIYNTIINEFGFESPVTDTKNTINQICNSYNIDETIKRDSIKLYDAIGSNVAVFQGTAPRTIAIVLIYISFVKNDRVPLFIKKTDLSIITLKKLYNKYLDNLYTISEINEMEYGSLKNKLDNGYKNKTLLNLDFV